MATFQKVNDFAEQLVLGVHDFDAHVFKVALTNTAPSSSTVSWTVGAFPAPAAANGYTGGGSTTTITSSETTGTMTVQGTQVVFTATAGGIGPFQYAILYNDNAITPVDAVVGYWDNGSAVTLSNAGDTFTVKFNNTNPGTIFTLAGA
jgi:hypothetical protein